RARCRRRRRPLCVTARFALPGSNQRGAVSGDGLGIRGLGEEAGIGNARLVKADWQDAPEVRSDVSLVSHVTYFVAEIVPFLEKLIAASRRRVIIGVSSTP